jgi:hypothetical protein
VLTQQLAGHGAAIAAAPLASIARPAGADALQRPDGARAPLAGTAMTAPALPGVYWLLRGDARVGALVVNVEAEESMLDRLDIRTLASRVRAADVRAMDDSTRFAGVVFAAAPRRPIGAWLVALALALLVLESAITASGRRAIPA